jgi:hypothetical protein
MRWSRRRLFDSGLVGGIVVLLAGGFAPSSVAGPSSTAVALGAHEFGHLAAPEAIVADAGPLAVGFENPDEGSANGPWSFDVARDGSIWLLDQFNDRLLMWEPGRPDQPARTVPLPQDVVQIAADVAVGPDGTIFISYVPSSPPDRRDRLRVLALTATGDVLWTTPTDIEAFNTELRTGPDGALYWHAGDWTPVTTVDGRPLSLAEQRRRATSLQPMPGGLGLDLKERSEREWQFTLRDDTGQVVQAWDVTSETDLGGIFATPSLLGGDLVVAFGVFQTQPDARGLSERLIVRLDREGGTQERFALDGRAVWGDAPVTGLRVRADGKLYQLRSDIDTGVSVARYSLGAAETSPPTATPSAPIQMSPSTPASMAAAPTEVVAPFQRSSKSALRWILPVSLIALALIGLGTWLVRRRRTAPG